jgi:copper(I)-binding protein
MPAKVGAALVAAMIVTACSAADGPAIAVDDAWGRPSPAAATNGAFYMVISNDGSEVDRLLAATSSACGVVELHESTMSDDGVMGMRPVEGGAIDIPAGGEVTLEPGGLHLMCIVKQAEFDVGAVLDLELEFQQSGTVPVEVEIREG